MLMAPPSNSLKFGTNWGIWASNGSLTPNTSDLFLLNDNHNWNTLLNGAIGLNGIYASDQAILPMGGSINLTGGFEVSPITAAWNLAGGQPTCSGGASSYTYVLTAVDVNGGTSQSSTLTSPASCTNPLTGGNPVTFPTAVLNALNTVNGGVFTQAKRFDVYRTGGPMATGFIGSYTCGTPVARQGCTAFVDTGLGASGSLPSGNSTGTESAKRYSVDTATTLVSGDFTLGTGWGSTAALAITNATSKDSAYTVTITTGGSGIAINPTLQITFHDGAFNNPAGTNPVPVCIQPQTGGNDVFANVSVSARSATSYTFTWLGTPTTGKTYEFSGLCQGT